MEARAQLAGQDGRGGVPVCTASLLRKLQTANLVNEVTPPHNGFASISCGDQSARVPQNGARKAKRLARTHREYPKGGKLALAVFAPAEQQVQGPGKFTFQKAHGSCHASVVTLVL